MVKSLSKKFFSTILICFIHAINFGNGLYMHKDLSKFLKFILLIKKNWNRLIGIFYLQDEINENLNSSVIENLKIDFDSKYGNDFPNEFSLQFNQFNNNFNIEFSKLSQTDHKYPVKSSDIYIIDESTGNPIKYNIKNSEVRNFETLKLRVSFP